MLNIIEINILKKLGERLKDSRLERNDSQKEFSCRIGVSIPTLYKMEQGDPSISIGLWVRALSILARLEDLALGGDKLSYQIILPLIFDFQNL